MSEINRIQSSFAAVTENLSPRDPNFIPVIENLALARRLEELADQHYQAGDKGLGNQLGNLAQESRGLAETVLYGQTTVGLAQVTGKGHAEVIVETHGEPKSLVTAASIRAMAIADPHDKTTADSVRSQVAIVDRGRPMVHHLIGRHAGAVAIPQVLEVRRIESPTEGLLPALGKAFFSLVTGEHWGTVEYIRETHQQAVERETAALNAKVLGAATRPYGEFIEAAPAGQSVSAAADQAWSCAAAAAAAEYQRAYETVARDFAPGGDLSGLSPMEAYPSAFDL